MFRSGSHLSRTLLFRLPGLKRYWYGEEKEETSTENHLALQVQRQTQLVQSRCCIVS